nr:MAG TPA: hypothetical protein [Caudoviricetes sp.]
MIVFCFMNNCMYIIILLIKNQLQRSSHLHRR